MIRVARWLEPCEDFGRRKLRLKLRTRTTIAVLVFVAIFASLSIWTYRTISLSDHFSVTWDSARDNGFSPDDLCVAMCTNDDQVIAYSEFGERLGEYQGLAIVRFKDIEKDTIRIPFVSGIGIVDRNQLHIARPASRQDYQAWTTMIAKSKQDVVVESLWTGPITPRFEQQDDDTTIVCTVTERGAQESWYRVDATGTITPLRYSTGNQQSVSLADILRILIISIAATIGSLLVFFMLTLSSKPKH